MIKKDSEQSQDISLPTEQSTEESSTDATEQLAGSFFQHWSESTRRTAVGVLIISVLAIGYLLLQSNKSDQVTEGLSQVSAVPTPSPAVQISPSPIIKTTNASASATSSPQPVTTSKPVATKKPTPSPTPITGVDSRFVDVHFYGKPEPNTAFTPYRVPNGGNITVSNEKNSSEFDLSAVLANHGSEESKNIWVHYYVDGTEVNKGTAYLPGNMVKDELVTRDSAQPVKIPGFGSHTVKIVIDPDNQSKDVNTSNNTYTFTYTVK